MAGIRQRARRAAYALVPVSFAAALILIPETAAAAAADGLRLCGRVLIPSLFPFFVCSNLLVELGVCARLGRRMEPVMRPVFHVGGAGAAALALGLLGGYPAGAQAAEALYRSGRLSRREAGQLLKFCNNSGPAFFFGVLGSAVFRSPAAGLLLYGTHAAGAVLTGVVLRPRELPEKALPAGRDSPPEPGFSSAFTASVRRAGSAILQVCMFVIVFSVASRVLLRVLGPLLPAEAVPLAAGALELTAGADALRAAALPAPARLTCAAFLAGFGGLSVHAQTQAILDGSGLTACLRAKLLHGLLSAALTLPAALLLFPAALPAGSFAAQSAANAALLLPGGVFCLVFYQLTGGNRRRNRV